MIRLSCATLLLLLLGSSIARAQFDRPYITITPAGCQDVFVRIYDQVKADQGLSDVEVLYDPDGVYTPDKLVSYNIAFDGPEPEDYYGNTTDSFKIKVVDPTQPAYMAVWAINHSGRSTTVEWRFKPIGLAKTGDSSFTNETIGVASCAEFKIKNHDTAVVFGGITTPTTPGFVLRNVRPAAGTLLNREDSVTFDICFTSATIDTLYDTLSASVGCNSIPIPLIGTGLAPIIDAEDVSFNGVDLNDTVCKVMRVWNRGSSELILSGQSTSSEFILRSLFPDTVAAHSYHDYTICFAPKGSHGPRTMDIVWTTNEPTAYAHGYKDTTHVTGISSPAGLHWDRIFAVYDPGHDTTLDANVLRFKITNTAHVSEVIDSVVIRGPQANTFVPYQMQFPRNVGLTPDLSVNVAIQWQPDIPPPDIQTATAYIFSAGVATDSLFLTGIFPSLDVSREIMSAQFDIYPNPVIGNAVHILVSDPSQASLDVLNIMGEIVMSTELHQTENEITLPSPSGGMYFVRVTQAGITQTKRLLIEP